MPGVAVRGGRLVLPALAALALAFSGCFFDSPVVTPGTAYDPDAAMRKAELAGLDSASILLIDIADTSDQILLWSGRPDTAEHLPVYKASEGKSYFFRIRGWVKDHGACYLAEVVDGKATVKKDSCKAAPPGVSLSTHAMPMAGFRDHFYVLGYYPNGTTLEFLPGDRWLNVWPSSLTATDSGGDPRLTNGSEDIELNIDPFELPPGPQRTWLRIRRDDRVVDSVEVRTVDGLARTTPLGGDTVDMGYAGYRGRVVVVPDGRPAQWLVHPRDPWVEARLVPVDGIQPPEEDLAMAQRPGTRRGLDLWIDQGHLPGPGVYTSMIYALGADSVVVDSLAVVVHVKPDDQLLGSIVIWNTDTPLVAASITVRLDGGARTSKLDAQGYYRFDNVGPGSHTVLATAPDRLGGGVILDMQPGDKAPIENLPMSHAVRVEPVFPEWDVPLIACIASDADNNVIAVSRGKPGGDEILSFRPDVPGAKPRIVPLGPAGAGKPPLAAAKVFSYYHDLYLSFPTTNQLGIIRNWDGTPDAMRLVDAPFEPFDLDEDSLGIMVSGRTGTGRLVLGFFRTDDLSLVRVDTLAATWDGAAPLERGPSVRAWTNDFVYLTTGNGPGKPERLIKHPVAQGEPDLAVDLPNPPDFRLAFADEGVMVFSAGPSDRRVGIFDLNLSPVRSATVGEEIVAAAVDGGDDLSEFDFMASATGDILAMDHATMQLTGRFSLPGGAPATLLMKTGNRIVAAASNKIFLLGF